MEQPNPYDQMAAEIRAMIDRAYIPPPSSGNGFNFEAWSDAITDFAAYISMNVRHRPRGADGKPSAALVEAVASMQASVADFVHPRDGSCHHRGGAYGDRGALGLRRQGQPWRSLSVDVRLAAIAGLSAVERLVLISWRRSP